MCRVCARSATDPDAPLPRRGRRGRGARRARSSRPTSSSRRWTELPALRLVQLLTAGAETWIGRLPDGVALSDCRGAHGGRDRRVDRRRAAGGLPAPPAVRRRPGRRPVGLPHHRGARGQAGVDRRSGRRRRADGGPPRPVRGHRPRWSAAAPATACTPSTRCAELLPAPRRVRGGRARSPTPPAGSSTPRSSPPCPTGPCWSTPRAAPSWTPTRSLAELTAGRLRAALDVTDPEPLPAGHPLWSAPGLLLTPHVGGSVPLAVGSRVPDRRRADPAVRARETRRRISSRTGTDPRPALLCRA